MPRHPRRPTSEEPTAVALRRARCPRRRVSSPSIRSPGLGRLSGGARFASTVIATVQLQNHIVLGDKSPARGGATVFIIGELY